MQLDEYQQRASETAIYMREIDSLLEPIEHHSELHAKLRMILRLSYVALGLTGEAGEFANKVKKLIRDETSYLSDENSQVLSEELGGTLWYNSQAAREIGKTLDSVAQQNLDILADRKARRKINGSGDDR